MNDKSSGQTCSKLGESVKTCFLRCVFWPELFFVVAHPHPPPRFQKIYIATSLYPRILCYVTPSPVNEIMNSRLDTKADEGIFEHSKREREGGKKKKKEGENIPKINFHLQGSCIFNKRALEYHRVILAPACIQRPGCGEKINDRDRCHGQ